MPNYWGKQIFTRGSFRRNGSKAKRKREREREREEREKRERDKVENNIGQLRIATPPRVAHAKPPWPLFNLVWRSRGGDRGVIFVDHILERSPGGSSVAICFVIQ